MSNSQTAQPRSASRTSSVAPRFGPTDMAMLAVVLIWGLNFPLVKYALREMLPLTFNGLRFVLSSALTLGLVLLSEKSLHVARRDWGRLVLLGLVGNTVYQIFFIKGIAITKAGNSALLIATNPIFVALLSGLWGGGRLTRRTWLGIALSFVGMFLVIANSGSEFGLDTSTFAGDGLALLAAICWAIYTQP